MHPNTKYLLPILHGSLSIKGNRPATGNASIFCRMLPLFGITLVLAMSLTAMTWASDQTDTGSYENIDTRWLPWLDHGAWFRAESIQAKAP